MRIPAVPRRRSSLVYNPGSLLQGSAYTPPQEAAEEAADGAAPMDTDVNEMTPEEIESMIRKLQVGRGVVGLRTRIQSGWAAEVRDGVRCVTEHDPEAAGGLWSCGTVFSAGMGRCCWAKRWC